MSMFELTTILWRRRILVVGLAAAVFIIGAIALLAARSTTYTASSQILFDQPGLVVTEGGATVPSKIDNLMPTFCKLVSSNQVATAAAANAGPGVSPGTAAAVRCSPETNTLVALLQYSDSSATRAQQLVASVADQLVSAVQQRYDQAGTPPALRLTAQVIQASHASRNSNGTVRGLGLVATAAIIVAAAFALAVEPHRRDWDRLPPLTEEQIAVRVPQG
jgi:capsular polysaccharide biosynthesis protein